MNPTNYTKDIVSKEVAIQLKQIGFDVHCDFRYCGKESQSHHDSHLINWKDYRVLDAINCCDGYAHKELERLSELYFDVFENNDDVDFYISAPSFSIVQDWLFNKYDIDVFIVPSLIKNQYRFVIRCEKLENRGYLERTNYDTRHQAENAAISKAIEIIKTESKCKN